MAFLFLGIVNAFCYGVFVKWVDRAMLELDRANNL